MTALWLDQLRANTSLKDIEKNVVGQIYDSPVDLHHVPKGIAEAAFKPDTLMCAATEKSIRAALVARPEVYACHQRASDTFWHRPLACPTLWMLSPHDVISPLKDCQVVMGTWEKKGIDVSSQIFYDSKHCMHFRNFRRVYSNTVNDFIDKMLIQNFKASKAQSEDINVSP